LTTICFLGISLDIICMEIRLPTDKLQRIIDILSNWLGKKKARKTDALSLVGLLQHTSKVVWEDICWPNVCSSRPDVVLCIYSLL